MIEKEGALEERFHAKSVYPYAPRYNVAPSQIMPVVVTEGERKIEAMRWGLIPHWAKEASIGYKMINARSETVAKLPSFKKSLALKRCLVPASGFYEWQQTREGKTPFYIHLKDQQVFSFAGLYDAWKSPEGKEVKSYTIITTTPNIVLAPIHNRMPVILKRVREDIWLNPDVTEPEKLLPLLSPYPAGEMEAYPVSKAVNSPSVDMARLVEKA
jgi:putative SOS response-associated peptidase YedK